MYAPFSYEGNRIEECSSRVFVNKATEEYCIVVYTGEAIHYKIMGNPWTKTVSIFKVGSAGDTYITAAENLFSALAYVTGMKGRE